MKTFVASLLLLASGVGLSATVGAVAPDAPPGVGRDAWVRLSDILGFVVQYQQPASFRHGLPAVVGYFLVKQNGRWWDLDSHYGPDMLPGAAPRAGVRLSDTLGFVAQYQRPASFRHGSPAVVGYFVVKQDGRWWDLDSHYGPDMPPGAAPRAEVRLSDTLGFVVQYQHPASFRHGRPAVVGYFVVKRNGRLWDLDSHYGPDQAFQRR